MGTLRKRKTPSFQKRNKLSGQAIGLKRIENSLQLRSIRKELISVRLSISLFIIRLCFECSCIEVFL